MDTIAALSTASGVGAIAVVRMSGPEAFAIVDRLFSHRVNLMAMRQATFGSWHGADRAPLDQVVVTLYAAPASYTGEDVAEIACHGGLVVQRDVLRSCLDAGARLALPGEFSRRAVANGKIDLAQAEAIADLINASSVAARRVALNNLRGGIRNRLSEIRQRLLRLTALLELELDFSEEDVQFADRAEVQQLLSELAGLIENTASSFEQGQAIVQGIKVCLVGAPNAGKSTLLNALLNDERAIVAPTPGTTRDLVEGDTEINGLRFHLIDTAGLRESDDAVEQEGIRRTRNALTHCHIVVLLSDVAQGAEAANAALTALQAELTHSAAALLPVISKCDDKQPAWLPIGWLPLSAYNGRGLEALRKQLTNLSPAAGYQQADVVVCNERHHRALLDARDALRDVQNGLTARLSSELLTPSLRRCADALGSITGEVTSEDVLGEIFSHFCIGK